MGQQHPSLLFVLTMTWCLTGTRTITASAGCIRYVKVEAHTGSYNVNVNADQYGEIESRLAIQLQGGQIHSAPITGRKYHDFNIVRQIHTSDFLPSFPDECLTRDDIVGVYLYAPSCSTDGWLVTSINTYVGYCGEHFSLLTSDPHLNKWIDYDNQNDYPYNASLVPLSMMLSPRCITLLILKATTADASNAGVPVSDHRLVLQLRPLELQGVIAKPVPKNSQYVSELSLTTHFVGGGEGVCVLKSNITQVRIEAGGNDGWKIAAVTTLVREFAGGYSELTSDPIVNRWVDGNGRYDYNARELVLSLV